MPRRKRKKAECRCSQFAALARAVWPRHRHSAVARISTSFGTVAFQRCLGPLVSAQKRSAGIDALGSEHRGISSAASALSSPSLATIFLHHPLPDDDGDSAATHTAGEEGGASHRLFAVTPALREQDGLPEPRAMQEPGIRPCGAFDKATEHVHVHVSMCMSACACACACSMCMCM